MNTVESIDQELNHKREFLTGARKLDQFGRRVERFLLMQLQQLELAISAFERERAAWQRQRQAEISQLEQARSALAETGSDVSQQFGGRRSQAGWSPTSETANSEVPTQPSDFGGPASRNGWTPTPEQAAGSAPLRMLLQPGTASEFWLGAMMMEISKLNWQLGGTGIRFEPVSCRVPHGKFMSSRGEESSPAIIELEAFSCTPLLGDRPQRGYGSGPAAAVLTWERFKSLMVMTSLVDEELNRTFRKTSPGSKDHEDWQKVAKAARRAEDSNVKFLYEDAPAAADFVSHEDRVQRQLKRVEVTCDVVSTEHGSKIHVFLV